MAMSTAQNSANEARVFLTAQWLNLMLVNYAVPVELLEPLVPKGTELDLLRSETYVSVVGFMFVDTRVRGMAIPFHRTFEEVNLRFYVKRVVDGQERHAVTFVRELVPRTAVMLAARLAYNEPYSSVAMSHRLELNGVRPGGGRAEYRWGRDARTAGALIGDGIGPTEAPPADSDEAFMTQRHWGYTRQRDGSTVEYHVAHPVWRVGGIERGTLEGNLARAFGPKFAAVLAGPPASAFFADGSRVTVHDPVRLR
jgi:uncharacterized protein YqjF (DUF2071 family)